MTSGKDFLSKNSKFEGGIALIGVIISLITLLSQCSGSDDKSPQPEPSETTERPTDSPPGTEPESPSPSSGDIPTTPTTDERTPPQIPSDTRTQKTLKYLSDLPSIEGDSRENIAIVINRGTEQTFQHSLRSQRNMEKYYFEYNVEGGFRRFCATVGVDHQAKSGTVIGFTVYLDVDPAGDYRATDTSTQNIDLPIGGRSKIKLASTVIKSASYASAVWGNARFANRCY